MGRKQLAPSIVVATVVVLVIAASALYSATAAEPACESSLGWDLDRHCAVSGGLSSQCCDVVLTLVERGGIRCLCRVAVDFPFVYSGYSGDDVLIWYSQGCGGPAKVVPGSCLDVDAADRSAPEPSAFSPNSSSTTGPMSCGLGLLVSTLKYA